MPRRRASSQASAPNFQRRALHRRPQGRLARVPCIKAIYVSVGYRSVPTTFDGRHTELSFAFHSQFLPPAFELLKGQPPPKFTTIGDKTIADVVEALIGAAYETGFNRSGLREGFETALQAAIALHVDVSHIKEWGDFAKICGEISGRATVAEMPVLIEEKLAHRFEHGHLLTEALVS